MLEKDTEDRISIQEVIQHPWLNDASLATGPSLNLAKLREFSDAKRLKRAIIMLIA
jgi:serine/threonine protein kinase